MTYDKFRTGLTYQDVAAMMWVDSEDSAHWQRKSKGAVLGLMAKIKRDMWEAYTGGMCSPADEWDDAPTTLDVLAEENYLIDADVLSASDEPTPF